MREHTTLEEPTIDIMVRLKLDQVGLSGFENFMPSQLSGGMKKRAAVARALAMDPEILFFDEPSAGLDPIIAAGIDHLILELKKAFHMTIIVVTHELASAFLIADRMVLINKGDVIAIGTVDEMQNSKHPKVRQFLDRIPEPAVAQEMDYLQMLTESHAETRREASGEEQLTMESRREQVFVGFFVLIATALMIFIVFALSGAFAGADKTYHREVCQRGRSGTRRSRALCRRTKNRPCYQAGDRSHRSRPDRYDFLGRPRTLPVKTDSKVAIMSFSPLGDNHLEIKAGSPKAPRAFGFVSHRRPLRWI